MNDSAKNLPYTLSQATEYLSKNLNDGVACPCCGQFAKRYRRKITSSMAYALILINRAHKQYPEKKWLHVERYLKQLPGVPTSMRGDFAKLIYWDLIVKEDRIRDDGSSRNGYYAITSAGRSFVSGGLSVPKYVLIYNNQFQGFEGDYITIKQSLGSKFNYNELMNGQ
jgi:hypothetical protein